MALQSSGSISIGDLATEFGDTAPNSLSEFYRGGSLVTGTIPRSVTYTELYGYNGSPSIGTQYPNAGSFSYAWHNRTFSGDQSRWGTSMVRETDEVVARCLMQDVNTSKMGWRWTSGYSGYTQNPYYFKMVITGKHKTSSGGTQLTGTHYYTGRITRDNQSDGQAEFTRRSGNPPEPSASSINNGSTTELESGIYYIYDLIDCDVSVYFNAYQPNTSSASFDFSFNATGVSANEGVPESGIISLTDFYSAENV